MKGDRYPEEAGYPIATSDKGPLYYKLEVHYDNANLDEGVVDNSGVRWYYTDKLRQHDMDILLVGIPVFYAQVCERLYALIPIEKNKNFYKVFIHCM